MSTIATRVGSALLCLYLLMGCASDEEKMQAHVEKGTAYFEKEEYRAAVIEFKNAIQINSEYVAAYLKLGEAYLHLENFSAAYRQYSTIVRLDPSNITALIKLAAFNHYSKKYDQAHEQTALILAQEPDHLDALYLLAALYHAENRNNEAAASYQKIIDIDQTQRPSYVGLANELVAQRKFARGEAYLNQAAGMDINDRSRSADTGTIGGALAFKPRYFEVYNEMVSVYLEQKDYASALAMCDRQLAHPGHSPTTMAAFFHAKGQVLLAQDKRGLAEAVFIKAIETDAGHLESYQALAKIYLGRNEPGKAVEIYQNAQRDNPQQIQLWMDLGDLYDGRAEYELAEKQYRKALSINPGYAPAANNLAYLLANTGANLDEALTLATLAKAKQPHNAAVLDTLGWVYYKQTQYDRAIEAFRESLREMPGMAIVHYHLSQAYESANQIENAVDAIEKTLALDHDFPEADQARQRLSVLRDASNS